MDIERDEMFRLTSIKMANWTVAAKLAAETGKKAGGAAAAGGQAFGSAAGGGGPKVKAVKGPSTFIADTTPPGEKKDCTQPMNAEYHPRAVEAAWYAWWEKKGFFHADAQTVLDGKRKMFTMVIPPPNVTGALHLGHALMLAVEDAITRQKRMKGYEVLWLPGVDHAGIATQSVVEKQIWKKDRKTRHDYGREDFVEKVWSWKNEYGGKINNQFKRYAISVDWERFRFTLDDSMCTAVTEAFVRMFEKGLIYRDTRLVNWSCKLKTALSDLEVEYMELTGPTMLSVPGHDPNQKYEFGALTHFEYKIKGTDERIEVATTRLETMLGDVAVAVHPDDPRYKKFHGKELEHPFIKDRKMKVITDPVLVNMDFGTGAVKITPAHDPNDYQCGKRHDLEQISVFDEDGKINNNGGQFLGLARFDARNAVKEALAGLGLLKGTIPNPMRIGRCSKSGDIIEPLLKPQWYVNCSDMAARSVAAVKNKELTIIPDTHEKTWF